MKNALTLLALMLLPIILPAQITNEAAGARAQATANASINSSDVWAIHNNIAALAEFTHTEAALAIHNRFGMADLNTMSFAATHRINNGTAGISIRKFGDNLYNESSFGLGFAHKIDFVSLGVKANLMQVSISELGSRAAVAFEFGGLVHLNKELTLGANIYNINQAKMASFNDERFATVMKAGITYHPTKRLNATIETEKDIEYKHNVKAGLEYYIIEKMAVRTGFSTLYQNATFGFGLLLQKFTIDYAFAYHNRLGISNGLSINYIINKNTDKNTEIEN